MNGTYSLWSEIIFGVLQRSILGSLLFNMFLCNLFQFFPDLDTANYADDTTTHSTNINLNKVLQRLEKESNTLFKWFTENLLKVKSEKWHLSNSTQETQINIGGMTFSNSKCKTLLGTHIDSKLTFKLHEDLSAKRQDRD